MLFTPFRGNLCLLLIWSVFTTALTTAKADSERSQQWIVSLNAATSAKIESAATRAQWIKAVSDTTELQVHWVRAMSGNAAIVDVSGADSAHEALSYLPGKHGITALSKNATVTVLSTSDDPKLDEQWQLSSPAEYRGAVDVINAWSVTHGSSDVVIAVVDTGIQHAHPDLTGRLLPGYDFVSPMSLSVAEGIDVPDDLEFLRSNDGDGRDSDPTDPGDNVSETVRAQFESLDIECSVSNSTWHGTAMASIIAANANDGIGMAGIDWHAKILPVRAIGKCGGRRADMLDAIRWSAGVSDPALPPNPHPARIVNLSLGVDDLCTAADQSAINDARSAGAIIIAAVGNNGRNTDEKPSSPSHCQNVIGVMAVDQNGYRASYSNSGRDADIAAPGGDIEPTINGIVVATNTGYSEPLNEFGYRLATGTSVAAPHVAAVLGLMLSVNPTLSNRELEGLLMNSARAFSGLSANTQDRSMLCNETECGAGVVDAYAAVLAADAHEAGTFIDSPALGAAQSVPVSVGGVPNGYGCSINRFQRTDPLLGLLLLLSLIIPGLRRINKITQLF